MNEQLPRDVQTARALFRVVVGVVAVLLILSSWNQWDRRSVYFSGWERITSGAFDTLYAQTILKFSGWERVAAGASDCTNSPTTDKLNDLGTWIDYGPGGGAVCSATPDLAEIVNTACLTGNNCLQLNFKDGDGDNGPDFRIIFNETAARTTTTYGSYAIKWSSNWCFPPADNKTMITNTSVTVQAQYINVVGDTTGSCATTAHIKLFPEGVNYCDSTNITITRGVWHVIDFRWIPGTGTSGSFTVRFDGTVATWANCTGQNPNAMNTGTQFNGFKLDTTINCFDPGPPNVCSDSWEAYVDTGQMWYDDVQMCSGDWCPTGASGDTTPPSISITQPTTQPTYAVQVSQLTTLAGICTDNVAVSFVTWSNNVGGNGTATGTTSWSVPLINLQLGDNVITTTCVDTSANMAQDVLTVSYLPEAPLPPGRSRVRFRR